MKKAANWIFILLLLLALAVVPLGTLLLNTGNGVSFWENRTLAEFPPLTVQGVLDGTFFNDVESWFSDHIPGRNIALKLSAWTDLLLGRPVVNGQVVASDVMLNFHGYEHWNVSYQQELAAQVGDRLAGINELVKGYGGYFCYLGVPQQYSYYADQYPDYMDNRQWTLAPTRQTFAQALAERDIPYVDMLAVYEELGRPMTFYSAVDHHYHYPGALAAYETVMERICQDTGLELNILREEDGLELVTLPNRYIGSLSREVYDLWPSDERAVIGVLSPTIPFTRYDNGVRVEPTLYTLPQTEEEPVLYSLYMGGDVAETVIETGRPELPNALIFGESYTNAVETVLWTAFNETRSLDLRHYTAATVEEYIAAHQPDVVICLRDDSAYLNPLDQWSD